MDALWGLVVTLFFTIGPVVLLVKLVSHPCRCWNARRGPGLVRNPKCPVHRRDERSDQYVDIDLFGGNQ